VLDDVTFAAPGITAAARGEVPGSKVYRDRLRDGLVEAGVTGQCLTEQIAANLARTGMRPRKAWRNANELSMRVAAMRFNEVTNNPDATMTGNRIGDFEQWPFKGARPTMRTLKVLARIYGTTWDLLVDDADLAHMPETDRAAYAEAATGRARATGAESPPPAEEIHIWMATADRVTMHVAIPRREATIPAIVSVFRGLLAEPARESRSARHVTASEKERFHVARSHSSMKSGQGLSLVTGDAP
jgi:hypothetical protein